MGEQKETLATYIGDLHALEQHMLEAFKRQLTLTRGMPEARAVVEELVSTTRQRASTLEQRLHAIGTPEKGMTDRVKTIVSGVLGVAAGAVDYVRPQQISKALRDSYTALNMAIISYVMLQTTGLALDDTETAQLAERHLRTCISNAQSIARIMPQLVVSDLRDNVGAISTDAAAQVTSNEELVHLFGLRTTSMGGAQMSGTQTTPTS